MGFFITCADCEVDAAGELTQSEVISWVNAHDCDDEIDTDDDDEENE